MSASPVIGDLSVLMLNYNGLDDTIACIRSILNADARPEEIVVVENGSRGNDAEALKREFGDRVNIIPLKQNIGVARGYNKGVSHAKGSFVVIINNDTEVAPGWLQPLMSAMVDPDVAVCQAKTLSWKNKKEFDYAGASGGFLDRFGYPFLRGRVFETVEEDRGQYDDPVDIHWASAACMIVRRSAWDNVNGIDERYMAFMEEVDLCWRLRKKGFRIRSVPASVVYHKWSRTWGRYPLRKRFLEHRNNILMLVKNADFPQILFILPVRIVLECLACIYYCCTGRFGYAVAIPLALLSCLWRSPAFLMTRSQGKRVRLSRVCIVWRYFIRSQKKFSELNVTL